MQLFLHTGTNKTGSSFLQTMLGRSRSLLQEKGIFFPIAEREEDMLAGKISPGNGGQLCRELVKGNGKGVALFFKNLHSQAQNQGCHSVLISNEKLIRALSHSGALAMMASKALEAGFSGIKALAVFREPVDHAMSLYQHRAKEGLHGDFYKWLNEDYETIRMLENFLPQLRAQKFPVEWTFRKYASSAQVMLDILFTDWLKIAAPDAKDLPAVNPSLTLSEIKLLQSLRKENPLAVKPLKAAFDKLSKQQKADDGLLRVHLRFKAYSFINLRRSVFDDVNEWMPAGEKLQLSPEPECIGNPESSFSAEQKSAIDAATRQAASLSFKLKEGMASGVKMVKRKIFSKPKLRDRYNLEP